MITKKRQNSRFFVNFVEKTLIPIKSNIQHAFAPLHDPYKKTITPMYQQQRIHTLIEKTLRQAGAAHIKSVNIALGEIAEISPAEFQRIWNEHTAGTPLAHAELHFRLIPGEVQCMACFKKYRPLNGKIHCPNCGSFGAKILNGEEIHVEHIETDQ